MEKLRYEIPGTNARVLLFETKLVIKRTGLLSVFRSDKELDIKIIRSVELKMDNIAKKGYLAFHLLGGDGKNAAKENTIHFTKGVQAVFTRMKQLVDEQIQLNKSGGQVRTTARHTGHSSASKGRGVYEITSHPNKMMV